MVEVKAVEELKVAATSRPSAVAGAIAGCMRSNKDVVIMAVGAGAVNQTVKSIAIANSYLAANGIRLAAIPGFSTFEAEDGPKTAIKFDLRRI